MIGPFIKANVCIIIGVGKLNKYQEKRRDYDFYDSLENQAAMFSCLLFSIHPVVDMSEPGSAPPRDGGVVDMKNQACYDAYVWAVHKTGINPKTLHSLLAPKQARRDLNDELKVNGVRFMHRLNCGESIFFCVPMLDSDHLDLKDNTLW